MSAAVQSLIEQLDTSSDKKADALIAKLAAYGAVAIKPLISAAQDESCRRIQKWSLQALGILKAKKAAPLLVKALKDERMTVRLHALHGLRRMKYKKSLQDIAKLLKDDSGGIRVNAVYALTELGDGTVASAIKKTLRDPKWYVRQSACKACGVLKIKSAKSILLKLSTSDERKTVRVEALAALALLQK